MHSLTRTSSCAHALIDSIHSLASHPLMHSCTRALIDSFTRIAPTLTHALIDSFTQMHHPQTLKFPHLAQGRNKQEAKTRTLPKSGRTYKVAIISLSPHLSPLSSLHSLSLTCAIILTLSQYKLVVQVRACVCVCVCARSTVKPVQI